MRKRKMIKNLYYIFFVFLGLLSCRQENYLNEQYRNNQQSKNYRLLKPKDIPQVMQFLHQKLGREDMQISISSRYNKDGIDFANIDTSLIIEKTDSIDTYYVFDIDNAGDANTAYTLEIKETNDIIIRAEVIEYNSIDPTIDFANFSGIVTSYDLDGTVKSSQDYDDGTGECPPADGSGDSGGGTGDNFNPNDYDWDGENPGDWWYYGGGSGGGTTTVDLTSDCWDRVPDVNNPALTAGYYNNCTGEYISLYNKNSIIIYISKLETRCDDGSGVVITDPIVKDLCTQLDQQSKNFKYKEKYTELNKTENFKLRHEKGYSENKSGEFIPLSVSTTDPNVADALSVSINNTIGFIHTHLNNYILRYDEENNPVEIHPIRIFSPKDIDTFMSLLNSQPSELHPKIYANMLSSSGNYSLKFSGSQQDIIVNKFNSDKWRFDFIKFMDSENGSLEKKFLRFLKEKMQVSGITLFKINNDGTFTQKSLDENNNVIKLNCP